MKPLLRAIAILVLMVALPVQASAAACAQICALAAGQAPAEEPHHASGSADHSAPGAGGTHEGCGKSEAPGKCCQCHVFVVELTHSTPTPPLVCLVGSAFVARWTSFIPEEPSPPPIVTASLA